MIAIEGPNEVYEVKKNEVEVTIKGIPDTPNNVGWWVENISGLAKVDQHDTEPAKATVTGLKAGLVRLNAVVGTRTAEKIIRAIVH